MTYRSAYLFIIMSNGGMYKSKVVTLKKVQLLELVKLLLSTYTFHYYCVVDVCTL